MLSSEMPPASRSLRAAFQSGSGENIQRIGFGPLHDALQRVLVAIETVAQCKVNQGPRDPIAARTSSQLSTTLISLPLFMLSTQRVPSRK